MPLPFSVRGAGHFVFPAGFVQDHLPGNFCQVTWCVEGSGFFTWHGKEQPIAEGGVFVYPPRSPRSIRAGEQGMEWYYWTFDGPEALDTIAAFDLKPGHVHATGAFPRRLFGDLMRALNRPSIEAEHEANAVAFHLLAHAARGQGEETAERRRDDLIEASIQVMEEEFTNPLFGVSALADSLGVDRSVLTRRFHAERGVTPKQHLTTIRVQRAVRLLVETDFTVSEISRLCGFSSPNYFTNVIRASTGKPPSKHRGELSAHIYASLDSRPKRRKKK